MTKFVNKTYNLDEEEMQVLLARAKQGDAGAQLELLEIFSNFLAKYVTLLWHGKYSLTDYDIRKFISLFVKDKKVNGFLLRNQLNTTGYKHVQECIRGIQYMTTRYGDEEDVTQTVTMAFLECVRRYERRGAIPFSGYLYGYFLFILKKMVDSLLIDQLGRKTFPLLEDDSPSDADADADDRPPGFAAPPTPPVDELLGAELIDEYWVVGDTAMPPFDVLSVQERQLLRWRYVDRERSSDIALRITEHPNTVREHISRIREKLQETIAADLDEH